MSSSLLGESNTRRRLSIPELGGPNMKRRLSIPELNITGGQRKSDCKDLPEGGAILSRSVLSMDRAITPEQAYDPNPDRAFTNLRPVSPAYIPQHLHLNSLGNSLELSDEDCDTEKPANPANIQMMGKTPGSTLKEQQFQVIRPKSRSRRHLVKIPIETKKAQKSAPKYPTSMLNYERGVSPTPPQMTLADPNEPSLTSLRAKAKLRIGKNIRKNLEIMQLKFAARAMEPEFEQMENEMANSDDDLIHIMGEDGKMIWKNIDNAELESVIDDDIDSMPTMDQNKFQDMDPEDILDAFLTDKYIVLETDRDYQY